MFIIRFKYYESIEENVNEFALITVLMILLHDCYCCHAEVMSYMT